MSRGENPPGPAVSGPKVPLAGARVLGVRSEEVGPYALEGKHLRDGLVSEPRGIEIISILWKCRGYL